MSTLKTTKGITMLSIEEIKVRLSDKNLAEVARRLDMSRQQLWRIATGDNDNPTMRTVQKISDYLEGEK